MVAVCACEVKPTTVTLGGAGEPFAAVTMLARKRSGSDEAFVAVQTLSLIHI